MSASKKLASTLANAAAGGAATYVDDVFSTYLYEGTGSSRDIQNGINLGSGRASGSALFDTTNTYLSVAPSSDFAFGTGNFTVECWIYRKTANETQTICGTRDTGSTTLGWSLVVNSSNQLGVYSDAYQVSVDGITLNKWHHVALTYDGNRLRLYIDGAWATDGTQNQNWTTQNFYIGSTPSGTQDWDGYIADLRLVKGTALYTATEGGSFTVPTSALTAVSGTSLLCLQGDDPFTDNSGNAHTITTNGTVSAATYGPYDGSEEGSGGMVWIKDRDAANYHRLADTERGSGDKWLYSNSTDAENTYPNRGYITSFNADGFTLGGTITSGNYVTTSGTDFTSWTFRKAPGFFDVVTYTGDGNTYQTISHNLGCVPGMIIVKRYDTGTENWNVYHKGMGTGLAYLNTTSAYFPTNSNWNFTTPTSTTFDVRNSSVNASGGSFVAYLFADGDDADAQIFGTDGDQAVVKCGSYEGSGSNTDVSVDLGFEPQWVLIKNVDDSNNRQWCIFDNMRGVATGGTDKCLYPNSSEGENASNSLSFGAFDTNPAIEFTSTGFKIVEDSTSSYTQTNRADTHIYIAIRRPHKPAESGTEVFDLTTHFGTGLGNTGDEANGVKVTSDVIPDLVIAKLINGTSQHRWWSRLTDHNVSLASGNTDAEYSGIEDVYFDHSDGWVDSYFGDAGSSNESVNWGFKRSPGFFDVVCYTGDGVNDRIVDHNLGAVPELIITKQRDASRDWFVLKDPTGGTYLRLNSTNAEATATDLQNSAWTDTTYRVGLGSGYNASGSNYIAYLFASQAGISKVGSYTGDGTTDGSKVIDCGFSNGARFVLIKATSTTGNWTLLDSERGINASANDPYLRLNTTDAQSIGADILIPDSSGFAIREEGPAINTNGVEYIFLAIA